MVLNGRRSQTGRASLPVVSVAPSEDLSSSLHSRRIAVVVSQYPAQPFATLDFPSLLFDFIVRFDDSVGKALMILFFVVMPDKGFGSATQKALSEEDHSRQALFFETPNTVRDWRSNWDFVVRSVTVSCLRHSESLETPRRTWHPGP